MSELATIDDTLTKDELKQYILEAAGATVEGIKRVADGVRRWKERGFDIEELERDIPFVQVFWLIGCGQVIAELFFRYGHTGRLWDTVSRLPVPLQKRLCESPYRLPVVSEDGSERMIDPLEMTGAQLDVVFDRRDSRIRTAAEQRSRLEAVRPRLESTPDLKSGIMPSQRGCRITFDSGDTGFLTWKQVAFLGELRERWKK